MNRGELTNLMYLLLRSIRLKYYSIMTNQHEQQLRNPTRREVNRWLAGFVGSAVIAGGLS